MAKLNYHIPLIYLAYLTLIFHFISCDGYTSNTEAPDSVEKGPPTHQIESLRLQQANLWDNLKHLEEKYNDLEKERIHLKSLETENRITNNSIENHKEKQEVNLIEQKK